MQLTVDRYSQCKSEIPFALIVFSAAACFAAKKSLAVLTVRVSNKMLITHRAFGSIRYTRCGLFTKHVTEFRHQRWRLTP